jgi:hypothetical protein
MIIGSDSHGNHDHILLSDGSGALQTTRSESAGEDQRYFALPGLEISQLFLLRTSCVYFWFNNTPNSFVYTGFNGRMIKGNNELERIRKEAVINFLEVLSRNSLGGTGEAIKKSVSVISSLLGSSGL